MEDRENIIRIAKSCGINFHQAGWPELERFAAVYVEDFLKRSGQYLTNDASREAEIAKAVAAERKALLTGIDEAIILLKSGVFDTGSVLETLRAIRASHLDK